MSLAPLIRSILVCLRAGLLAAAVIAGLSAFGACQAGDGASQDEGEPMQARVHARAELFESETGETVLTTLPAGSVVQIAEPDPQRLDAALQQGRRPGAGRISRRFDGHDCAMIENPRQSCYYGSTAHTFSMQDRIGGGYAVRMASSIIRSDFVYERARNGLPRPSTKLIDRFFGATRAVSRPDLSQFNPADQNPG